MAGPILFANNAVGTLINTTSNSSTTINLVSGMGALFPNPDASLGQYFVATLKNAIPATISEIIWVTARSGDVLTVIRGQEGTTPLAFSAGSIIANGLTAGQLASISSYTAPGTGAVTRSVPDRLGDVITSPGYGALNDGSDQTAAVNLAAAEARTLNVPLIIEPNTSHTGSLAGTPRLLHEWSKNDETDFLPKYAFDLYNGVATTIALFGDSKIWGADPTMGLAQSPLNIPASLQTWLQYFYGNTAATVTNAALSGTDILQMLAGTDGSGLTFEARVAASSASVIGCNHCTNSAAGATNATDGVTFKAAWIKFVTICRKHGKTPVIIITTPDQPYAPYYPAAAPSAAGGQQHAQCVMQYSQIMRQVAREMGVPLVDFGKFFEAYISSGISLPAALPDGVHGTGALYQILALDLASIFISPEPIGLNRQIIPGASPRFIVSSGASASYTPAVNSRCGISTGVSAPSSSAASIMIPIYVEDRGLDVFLAHPMWSAASNAVAVTIDNVAVTTISLRHASLIIPTIGLDMETQIANSIAPGFHIITLTCPANGVFSVAYLRARPNLRGVARETSPLLGSYNGATQPAPTPNKMLPLWDTMQMTGGSVSANEQVMMCPDYPVSCQLMTTLIEFKAQLVKGGGLGLACYIFADFNVGASQGARAGLVVGLDESTGFLVIRESGGNAMAKTVLGAVDLSAASHTYNIALASTGGANSVGTMVVSVDGTAIGSAFSLQFGWHGGCLGLYLHEASAGQVVQIDKLWLQQQ